MLPQETGEGFAGELGALVSIEDIRPAFPEIQSMISKRCGRIPDEDFAMMDTATFVNMPPEAFGNINPDAFGQMPTGTFGVMSTDAFAQMPDEAFDKTTIAKGSRYRSLWWTKPLVPPTHSC